MSSWRKWSNGLSAVPQMQMCGPAFRGTDGTRGRQADVPRSCLLVDKSRGVHRLASVDMWTSAFLWGVRLLNRIGSKLAGAGSLLPATRCAPGFFILVLFPFLQRRSCSRSQVVPLALYWTSSALSLSKIY